MGANQTRKEIRYDEAFAKLLSHYMRKKPEITPAELARRLGINRSTPTRWLENRALPGRPSLVVEIARIYELTENELKELLIAADHKDHIPTLSIAVTASPVSTSTTPPLAFAPEAAGETLIVIATFLVTEGNRNTLPQREIRDKIREETKKIGETAIRVEIEPTVLNSDQITEARALGTRYHASIIIWGDDTGARVTVNLLCIPELAFWDEHVHYKETKHTQLLDPVAFAKFVLDVLPTKLTFLALFSIGYSYTIRKNYRQAVEIIEATLNAIKGDDSLLAITSTYSLLGWLYIVVDPRDINRAFANFNKAIALNSNDANLYGYRGLAYAECMKLDEAIADFGYAIRLDPKLADAYFCRGCVYADQGKLSEAITDYTSTIQLKPDYVDAYNNRGNTYAAQQKLKHALEDYNQAILLDPNDVDVLNNRGAVYAAQGKLEEALADYNQAVRLDSNYAKVYFNRGTLYYYQGKLDEALTDYKKAIQLDTTNFQVYLYLGNVYAYRQQVEEAIVNFNRVIELKPDFAMAYTNRGTMYLSQGKYEDAATDLEKAISLDPTDATPYNSRGNLYSSQMKLKEAIVEFTKAISLKSDYVGAYYNLGRVYHEISKFEEAIDNYTETIRLVPEFYSAYVYRGICYRKLGRQKKALADFRRCLKLKPNEQLQRQVEQWISEIEADKAKAGISWWFQ